MFAKWIVGLFLMFALSSQAAEDNIKHEWVTVYDGHGEDFSLYVADDTFKTEGNVITFLAALHLPINQLMPDFRTEDEDKLVILERPAKFIYYYMGFDCRFEAYIPTQTDYYDPEGKLITSYKIKKGIPPLPVIQGYDTEMLYNHICRKEVTEKLDS
jgi:hypothetical protein